MSAWDSLHNLFLRLLDIFWWLLSMAFMIYLSILLALFIQAWIGAINRWGFLGSFRGMYVMSKKVYYQMRREIKSSNTES